MNHNKKIKGSWTETPLETKKETCYELRLKYYLQASTHLFLTQDLPTEQSVLSTHSNCRHSARGLPTVRAGHEQTACWATTSQTAPWPHWPIHGSTHRPSRQAEAAGQSRLLEHSPRALHPDVLASPTLPSGQEQVKDPGELRHMAELWQDPGLAHSSISTHCPFKGMKPGWQ